jgi:hypothetical protein
MFISSNHALPVIEHEKSRERATMSAEMFMDCRYWMHGALIFFVFASSSLGMENSKFPKI